MSNILGLTYNSNIASYSKVTGISNSSKSNSTDLNNSNSKNSVSAIVSLSEDISNAQAVVGKIQSDISFSDSNESDESSPLDLLASSNDELSNIKANNSDTVSLARRMAAIKAYGANY